MTKQSVLLTIEKNSRLDGFLLWLKLSPGLTEPIDSLYDKLSWLPIFFPAFYPGVDVAAGDVIEARCRRYHRGGSLMPDYAIRGMLHRKFSEPQSFHFCSPHDSTRFKDSPFYEALFAEWNHRTTPSTNGNRKAFPPSFQTPSAPALRHFLQRRLPEYMIPSSIVILGLLPRNRSGKVDRRALPYPNQVMRESHRRRPDSLHRGGTHDRGRMERNLGYQGIRCA